MLVKEWKELFFLPYILLGIAVLITLSFMSYFWKSFGGVWGIIVIIGVFVLQIAVSFRLKNEN